jgi:hypothetical protein
MTSAREKYEPWLRDFLRKRYPELESPLRAAIEAFDSIEQRQQIDGELLRPIVEAASSSRRPLSENATSLLGKLTERYGEARDAVAKMSKNTRSHVRFNAILCLCKSTPLLFSLDLIRRGLRDTSARVRAKAADWAGRLRAQEVVLDLEQALAQETIESARSTIEFELKLLRDGYILEPDQDDGFQVTTHSHDGVAGRWIKRSELEQRGIHAIVADLAARRY